MSMDAASNTSIPPTRWEIGGRGRYAAHFAKLIEDGVDVEGEARLADALLPRGAAVLDAGSGMGRIGAALQHAGHRVVAAEKDPELVAASRERYPDLPVIESDVLALTPASMAGAGLDTPLDLVVLVGNVITLAAPETEVRMLRTLSALLAPNGRILVGFHAVAAHGSARDYPYPEFAADVTAAGLRVQHHFGSYELGEPDPAYVVAVLTGA